jgi:hypothetical protein
MKSKITDLVAEGTFRVPRPTKHRRTAHIAIGRPRPVENDPNGDWYAPVFIEHYTNGIHKVMGVSSLDTLINALSLVNSFFHMHTLSCLEFNAPRKKEQKKRKATNTAL